jgi:hypothetical protein
MIRNIYDGQRIFYASLNSSIVVSKYNNVDKTTNTIDVLPDIFI